MRAGGIADDSAKPGGYKSGAEGFSSLLARLKSGANKHLGETLTLGAPRSSPYRRTANRELLLDHFHLQIVPKRLWNLNRAVSLLVGFD